MPHLTSETIRRQFLDFFREKEHTIVESASLVPHGDPTLLFTNAGMNQFKDVFLGTGSRAYVRAADTQKCLRVSGKHNDLEEVGHDTYHHTFFEMLGNWSFGDYFKREAIRWAWELLVDRWGLDAARLYATVHEGDEKLALDADTEAADLWRSETSIKPEHVLFFGSMDNFWMMGDTGPCGPCSEIHIDLRPDDERQAIPGASLVNAGHPLVMEIWNLVFIQYDARPDGTLTPLAAKHVDTGMGFERMVAVLQNTGGSTYDTDLFAPILHKIANLSPRREVSGYDNVALDDATEREKVRVAMRVIADHVRAVAFAIADGVVPGNAGRGYVIRRILRRAVRYGYQTLGFRTPFINHLIAPLVEKMGVSFPEIGKQQAYIERVIRAEEESFLETLGTGIQFFERITPYVERLAAVAEIEQGAEGEHDIETVLAEMERDTHAIDLLQKAFVDADERAHLLDAFSAAAARRAIPGEVAFLLHDTYGFPIDLTQLMAREVGLSVDMERYATLMQRQRDRARAAASFTAETRTTGDWRTISEGDDSDFAGYDVTEVSNALIRAVRTVEAGETTRRHEIVLDQTPFYAESGGQVGDTGVLEIGGETIQVTDVQKEQGRIVHVVDKLPSALDAPVAAMVDGLRRERIQKHHTATHLLHAALREILGRHVQQKGSLVAPDRLRFDFSHFERVTPEELRAVEQRVNEVVQRNIIKQEERGVSFDEAVARGAMALFGEKYGDRVRVIIFDPDYSIELCGGTHVGATGEIGVFRFVSEGSVAAGIRRVEALAGQDALAYIDSELHELERARSQFKTRARSVDEEIAVLINERKRLEKELETLRLGQLETQLDRIVQSAEPVGPARLATARIAETDMNMLRDLGQRLRDRLGAGGVGVLGTVDPDGEKVYLVASVADDLIDQGVQAGKLVGALARRVGGGGGGRPNLATAGGRQPENLDAALAAAPEVLREMLN